MARGKEQSDRDDRGPFPQPLEEQRVAEPPVGDLLDERVDDRDDEPVGGVRAGVRGKPVARHRALLTPAVQERLEQELDREEAQHQHEQRDSDGSPRRHGCPEREELAVRAGDPENEQQDHGVLDDGSDRRRVVVEEVRVVRARARARVRAQVADRDQHPDQREPGGELALHATQLKVTHSTTATPRRSALTATIAECTRGRAPIDASTTKKGKTTSPRRGSERSG